MGATLNPESYRCFTGIVVYVLRRIETWRPILSRVLFILSTTALCVGTVQAAQWARTYGFSSNQETEGYSLEVTADGGYIMAGCTSTLGSLNPPNPHAWLAKLDAGGNVIWQKTYGGTDDYCTNSVQPTPGRGYVVAGRIGRGFIEPPDAWVMTVNETGDIVWQKAFHGGSGGYWLADSAQPTSDGGYIVAGSRRSLAANDDDFWVAKLDAGGNTTWQRTYGGVGTDYARAVHPTADGGYIVAGITSGSFGVSEFPGAWVLRLDASGNVIWQKFYGQLDRGFSLQTTPDGGYILASGAGGIAILKLDAAGNITWRKTYGGPFGDWPNSVQPTADGGYIVAGRTSSLGDLSGAWMLKLDAGGNVTWQTTYGGGSVEAELFSARPTTDGGYIGAGRIRGPGGTLYRALVLKLAANGAISGCALIGTSNAVVTEGSTISGNSTATGVASDAVAVSSTAIALDSTGAMVTQCYSDATSVVPTEVPTLSQWGMFLMAGILALYGAVVLRGDQKGTV